MSRESLPARLRVVGHRGACGHAPENTVAGIRKAADLGARAVEFDVKLSADGVPLLLHDATVGRTTSGRGPVASLDFRAIRRLDAGSWFAPAFAGERVPSLEEALAVVDDLGLAAFVELKPCPGLEEATGRIAGGCLRGRRRIVVSSFSLAALAAARRPCPRIRRAVLLRQIPDDWGDRLRAAGAGALHVLESSIDRAFAEDVKGAGYRLRAFTVDDPARAAELYSFGVDAVFTGFPDRLLAQHKTKSRTRAR